MRIAGTLAVALAASATAACQDPTVTVHVDVPSTPRPYADLLASLSVSVLAPADPSLDCDALAFGRASADAIAVSQVTGVSFLDGATSAPIAGVPRLGNKLWLAEGRDADGNLVVAGCTPQGDIDADADVTITTEPSASITLAPSRADNPVPSTLAVTVDDGLVPPDPLPDRAVRWDVFGGDGSDSSGDTTVDATGAARLALTAPPIGGPVSIQVRARWARTQPAVASAFDAIAPTVLSLGRACTGNPLDPLAVDTADWAALHVAGHDAIAGLARDLTHSRLYVADWDGSAAVDGCSADLGAATTTFTTLRATTTDPVDRLLYMTATQWIESDVTAGASLSVTPRAPVAWVNLTGAPPVALVTLRACGATTGDNDLVLAQLADDKVRAFDVTGHGVQSALADALTAKLPTLRQNGITPRLASAGCVAQGPGEPVLSGLVIETPRQTGATVLPRYLVIDAGSDHGAVLPVASYGAVAFSDPTADQPFLLGGALDPSGAKVVRWRVEAGTAGYELREDARADSLGPPASIALGNLDGDDQLDMVWGLVDAVQGGSQDARLQVSLGCGAGDLPLDGVSPTVALDAAAVFLSPDPAGDRTSDLMVGTAHAAEFFDTDLAPTL